MSASVEYVGSSGTGSLIQSGGANNVALLYLGELRRQRRDSLSGSGQLSAASEFLAATAGATATFQQTGGTNAASLVLIGSGGSYLLGGGLLQVNSNLLNQGVFSGGSAAAALSGSGILDLSGGTLQNLGNISVSIAANSLLIVPAGFSPSTSFATFSNLGMTHTLGTTLTVPAGQGFGGSGAVNDPVVCQGTIAAGSAGAINLNGGLVLSASGMVQLGSGTLTNNDLVSGISGGSLSSACQFVGSGGTGTFTQSAGTNAIGNYLFLGYAAASSGGYGLTGGQLAAGREYVGYSGIGNFAQTAGTNNVSSSLYLGNNAGGSGAMSSAAASWQPALCSLAVRARGTLPRPAGAAASATSIWAAMPEAAAPTPSVGGQLATGFQFVGYSGTGSFVQSGGSNSLAGYLYLGYGAGGTYALSGTGRLSAASEYVDYSAAATFQQTGGTNTTSLLSIGSSGSYFLAGGLLQVNGSLLNQGTLSGGPRSRPRR